MKSRPTYSSIQMGTDSTPVLSEVEQQISQADESFRTMLSMVAPMMGGLVGGLVLDLIAKTIPWITIGGVVTGAVIGGGINGYRLGFFDRCIGSNKGIESHQSEKEFDLEADSDSDTQLSL